MNIFKKSIIAIAALATVSSATVGAAHAGSKGWQKSLAQGIALGVGIGIGAAVQNHGLLPGANVKLRKNIVGHIAKPKKKKTKTNQPKSYSFENRYSNTAPPLRVAAGTNSDQNSLGSGWSYLNLKQ